MEEKRLKKRLAFKTAVMLMIPGLLMIAFGLWLFFDTLDRQAPETYIDYDDAEARLLLETYEDTVILDVRTPEEFRQGHIPGSINIPLNELMDGRYRELDRSDLFLVVCQSGARSATASQFLIDNRFHFVYNLLGGLNHWPDPLVQGD